MYELSFPYFHFLFLLAIFLPGSLFSAPVNRYLGDISPVNPSCPEIPSCLDQSCHSVTQITHLGDSSIFIPHSLDIKFYDCKHILKNIYYVYTCLISHIILRGPILEIEPVPFWGILCLLQWPTHTKYLLNKWKIPFINRIRVIWVVVYRLLPFHELFIINP